MSTEISYVSNMLFEPNALNNGLCRLLALESTTSFVCLMTFLKTLINVYPEKIQNYGTQSSENAA